MAGQLRWGLAVFTASVKKLTKRRRTKQKQRATTTEAPVGSQNRKQKCWQLDTAKDGVVFKLDPAE